MFNHFRIFKPKASKQRIKLLVLSKRALTSMLKKAIFNDCDGSIYIQDLDTLLHMPQDFTFCLIAPQGTNFNFVLFEAINNRNGFFLYE